MRHACCGKQVWLVECLFCPAAAVSALQMVALALLYQHLLP